MLSRLPYLNFDFEYDTPECEDPPTHKNPELYREWVMGYFKYLAPDFFDWLEDSNLEEYVLGDDTAKYCRDIGIPTFEEWRNL